MSKKRKKRALGRVENDAPLKTGRAIMSFLIPPVGFITWAIHNGEKQRKADTALKLAAISTGIGLIGRIIYNASNKQ